jgi:hypothetical protein
MACSVLTDKKPAVRFNDFLEFSSLINFAHPFFSIYPYTHLITHCQALIKGIFFTCLQHIADLVRKNSAHDYFPYRVWEYTTNNFQIEITGEKSLYGAICANAPLPPHIAYPRSAIRY